MKYISIDFKEPLRIFLVEKKAARKSLLFRRISAVIKIEHHLPTCYPYIIFFQRFVSLCVTFNRKSNYSNSGKTRTNAVLNCYSSKYFWCINFKVWPLFFSMLRKFAPTEFPQYLIFSLEAWYL